MTPPHAATPSNELRAVLAACLGSTFVGSVPMFATHLYSQGMNAPSLLFWRYWIALLFLWPLAYATSPSLRDDWIRAGRGLFTSGILLGIAQTFTYFRSIQSLPTSIVATIFFTYPILTLAIDRYIFGKQIAWGSIAAVGLVFTGALLAGWPSLTLERSEPFALACAIATPLLFSVYIAIAYRFTRQASPFAAAASIYSGLGCGYAVIALFLGLSVPIGLPGWLSICAIAILGGVVQISSFSYALPRLSASGYSIIVSLELVTVVTLGVLILKETLTPVQALGVVLVVVGIVTDRIMRARS